MRNALYLAGALTSIAIILSVSHGSLAAVPPPGEDVFGMYADDNFNDDPSDDNPPYVEASGLVVVYIYLTNVWLSDIGGYEFALSYSGGAAPVMVNQGLPPQGVNFGSDNEFIVGVGTPLVPDQYGHAILMSPTYFVSDTAEVHVFVGPTSIPMVPDQISYVNFDDAGFIRAMIPASGDFNNTLFIFNPMIDPVFGSVTWSSVKALYR